MPRGGARVGAGRKPKALIYATEINVTESMMVGALPITGCSAFMNASPTAPEELLRS